MTDYKYDVAFSFLQEDEQLAINLNVAVKKYVSTFIYIENQKELVGRDGEDFFGKVFGVESRLVVILYREKWGTTKWTRIEETAIKNRGFDNGYDFVMLIPLDKPVFTPKWLPKNRIWLGIEERGIDGAAIVIESRVQELFGELKPESLAEKVLRRENELKNEREINHILTTEDGYLKFQIEYQNLLNIFNEGFNKIKEKNAGLAFNIKKNRHKGINVVSYGISLIIQFNNSYSNNLKGAIVGIDIWEGWFDENLRNEDPFQKNKKLKVLDVVFDINKNFENGWSQKDKSGTFKNSSKLVEDVLESYFDEVLKFRKRMNY
jgi:hypothetical protein